MNKKQVGYAMIAMGALGIVLSIGAERMELGKGSIRAIPWLGVEIGVVICFVGAALIVASRNGKLRANEIAPRLPSVPADTSVVYWVLAGFLVTYLLFFISPVFLNSQQQFQYFDEYLPPGQSIGMDIHSIRSLVQDWVLLKQYHYRDGEVWYPPLYNIVFAPVAFLSDRWSYPLITFITLLSYFLLVFVLPKAIPAHNNLALILLFFITGLTSYGFRFELERGQYNVIIFLLCLFAVYLFHYHEEFRVFAYLLFTFAVQLKLYPAIFAIMFIKDWSDWKNNIKRMIGLGLLNFAALFILGYSVFIDFLGAILFRSSDATMDWIGNHSIKSFIAFLTSDDQKFLHGGVVNWVQQRTSLLIAALFLYFLICFWTIVIIALLRRDNGMNIYLLLACTVGMLVIPSVSHDYKLALLAAPMSIFFANISLPSQIHKRWFSYFLISMIAIAYFATTYSYKYRPGFIANSLPLLFIILTVVTLLNILKPLPAAAPISSAELESSTAAS